MSGFELGGRVAVELGEDRMGESSGSLGSKDDRRARGFGSVVILRISRTNSNVVADLLDRRSWR